jgi:penicillin-binding protein-related factor A (putative recombinase)
MSQPEANLTGKIRRYLNSLDDSFFFKVRGGPGQHKGVSDLIGVYHGRFTALEVKLPSNKRGLTLYQKVFLQKVKRAGGRAYVVRSLADAKRVFT